MSTPKNRRRMKRWKVAVLVRCSMPKFSKDVFEMEMWAKDVNEKGMQLEWTKGLTVSHIPAKGDREEPRSVRFEDLEFAKGSKIMVQDLFYDDDGSPFMEGRVLWARQVPSSGNWNLGIGFVKDAAQSKELLGAFKDFLSIVKNPTAAIAKASRKK